MGYDANIEQREEEIGWKNRRIGPRPSHSLAFPYLCILTLARTLNMLA